MSTASTQYHTALNDALLALELCEGLEPRSALKQAAADNGIDYGEDMARFVTWAEGEMQ